jgi:DNA-binding transcriptional ArsR family regulator
MLEPLFGNSVVERVLLYLLVYETGYIRGIAAAFGIPVNGVAQQLRRLEDGGVVVSQLKGKIRLYSFNPRYPFVPELKNLLQRALDVLPDEELEKYYRMRTRPRRKGKP